MATLDEDSADDDELSSEFASELSLETELSELASPAGRAGRLLELADSELEEDEAVSELDEDDSLEELDSEL